MRMFSVLSVVVVLHSGFLPQRGVLHSRRTYLPKIPHTNVPTLPRKQTLFVERFYGVVRHIINKDHLHFSSFRSP